MHQQRPGHLADREPQRGQQLLAVPPRTAFIVAEELAQGVTEPPGVPAVALPGRQPRAQLVVAFERGPVPQPLRDLAGRVDDERQVGSALDAMDPALIAAAVVDAGGAEPGPYRQRRHRMAGFVPGRLHGRLPGAREPRKAAAVITLPDPDPVHNGLVVIADKAG